MRDRQSLQEDTKKWVVHIWEITEFLPVGTYQFIMTPLMSKLLSDADFVETDTTYNENTELI